MRKLFKLLQHLFYKSKCKRDIHFRWVWPNETKHSLLRCVDCGKTKLGWADPRGFSWKNVKIVDVWHSELWKEDF